MSVTRLTITDIARRAEVSTTAVSYALNDRPGVSEATRGRILAIADSLGWRPSSAARTLHSEHTNALGLLLIGAEHHGADSLFLFEFLAGIQDELRARDTLLVLHTAPDIDSANDMYRRWRAEHRVDGIILMNPLIDDPRIAVLTDLRMPTVVIGDTRRKSTLPAVWTDDRRAARIAVDYLVDLGHRRIARIGMCPQYLHSEIRRKAFVTTMRRAGLEPDLSAYAGTSTEPKLILDMMRTSHPPTAVIFEDPSVAVKTTAALQKAGLTIPEELSVIAWDDTELCRLFQPTLTALQRDVRRYGRLATQRLVAAAQGDSAGHVQATTTELVIRESTVPPHKPGKRSGAPHGAVPRLVKGRQNVAINS